MSQPIFFFFFTLCFSVMALSAAELPVYRNTENTQRAQVTATGRISAARGSPLRNTPRQSLAARVVTDLHQVYRWTPSAYANPIRPGADLLDAALSPDASVLWILERIGGDTCNSTRLLYFNPASENFIACREFSERRLTALLPRPGTDQLILLQEAQPEFEQPSQLLCFDSANPDSPPTGFAPAETAYEGAAADQDRLWVTRHENSGILEFDLNQTPPVLKKHYRSSFPGGKLLWLEREEVLLHFGDGRLERLPLNPETVERQQEIALPHGFRPDWGIALPFPDGTSYLLAETGGDGRLFTPDGHQEPLTSKTGNGAAFSPAQQKLAVTRQSNEELAIYLGAPIAGNEDYVAPRKLKPTDRNDNFRIFSLSDRGQWELLRLDHTGSISRLTEEPRRWKKELLYEAEPEPRQ